MVARMKKSERSQWKITILSTGPSARDKACESPGAGGKWPKLTDVSSASSFSSVHFLCFYII